MVNEIQPEYGIGVVLSGISTIPVTKSEKRWRQAYLFISFSNTLLSTTKRAKRNPHFTITPEATNPDNHSQRSQTINQTELTDLMEQKDLTILEKFNGVEGLAKSLGIMDRHDIEKRKIAFGSNAYKKQPLKGFFDFVMEAFKDTTILVLLACASLSLGFGIKENGAKKGWYEGGSIFAAVVLVITVFAVSNFKQERRFDHLSKLSNKIMVTAIREKRRQKISIFDVVVGDIIVLNTGDQIPADGLFVDGDCLLVDESSMTGESDLVDIDADRNPFLFSGSKVADGNARMLVMSVGMNTAWGKMMSSITSNSYKQTPIGSHLNKLMSSIAKLGFAVTLLDLAISGIRYCTGYTKDKNGNWNFNGTCTDTNEILNSVTRAVTAIAEGLPLAVTLTLAYSINRMMVDHAIVRKLSACETMGLATVICSDKTGTLTMNEMTVTKFWLGMDQIEHNPSSLIETKVLQLLRQGVGLNTTTTRSTYESVSETEKAISSWAKETFGMEIEKLNQTSTILHVDAFHSEKKQSGVRIKMKEDDTIQVHWKGAAEMVLAMCTDYYQKDGLINSINHEEMTQFEKIIQGMSASSLRCIAFAHKQTEDNTNDEEGLILLGIIGIKDPCRQGAKEAIDTLRSAGVEIKLITGDNVFTAKAIATECGILIAGQQVSKGEVIEGEEFRNYTDDERMKKVNNIRIMARSTPADRLLMVQCLKKKDHVVAVIAHDTNNAPAFQEADIGLSIGIQETDIANENSDIVILNGGFPSVIMALNWGRCVHHNIQNFIQFQLTANVSALVINFVKAASAGGVPLIPVQQLCVNLIINIFGALALATEWPTKELMHKPPAGRDAPLITNIMWRNLLAQALYQILILLTFQFRGTSIFDVNTRVKDTIIFNTFVLCQVFNLFNSRKLEKKNIFEGLYKNWLFLGIIGMVVMIQVAMVEYLHNFAGTEKLNMKQWGTCMGVALVSWFVGWFVKFIPVQDTPFLSYIQALI